ncbi:DUF6886 family protein [Crossiella sp. NPDC003009]
MAEAPVWHFSEDPGITEFRPHRAPTSSDPEPAVWAVEEARASDFWFPRDCPRVLFRPEPGRQPSPAALALLGGARQVAVVEWGWWARVCGVRLFRYAFAPGPFRRCANPRWYLTAREAVRPLAVQPVGDVVALHAAAGIELRLAPNLWPVAGLVERSGLEFSMIRMRNALPRPADLEP